MATTTKNVFSTRWTSELDIEEYSIIHQYHMNSLAGDVPQSFSSLDDTTNCFNFDASCNNDLVEEIPSKILKTTHISPKIHPFPSSIHTPPSKHQPSSRILSFEKTGLKVMNHNSPNLIFSPKEEEIELQDQRKSKLIIRGTKRAQTLTRSQSNAQDHILAERKRREKLTQRFVALSALVPGLKKMDKASVLGDAIKHIKYLHEKVKEYEEQKQERTMESMVLVKKSQLVLDENYQSSSSSSDGNRGCSSSNLPEIEVRLSGKDVLIKILCEKQKGNLIKIMGEIEKLGLLITNSNVLPFGPTFDISIIAQRNINFDMKIEDVVKNLSCGLSKLT